MQLIGREQELAAISDLVRGLSGIDRALLIRGDAGVGKTALVTSAVEMARQQSALIFRATGVQAESEMPFSSLHQLMRPLLRVITSDANDTQRAFAEIVDPAATVGFDVANAVMDAIDRAALQAHVLIIIDDLQWIDEASAQVLAFVARRLTDQNVSLIAATRLGYDSPWERAGLPELSVGPLNTTQASELLTMSSGPLDPGLSERILDEARGNPLALIELPRGLTADQRAEGLLNPDDLPISQKLEDSYIARLGTLRENSRQLLLLCALDRTGTIGAIKSAAGDTWFFPDLVNAHSSGLINIIGSQIEFRHPLVRSAVIHASTESERGIAHRAIAATFPLQSDLWAWHMAAASDSPDDDLADALEKAARKSLSSGGLKAALHGLQQSVRLSLNRDERWRRTAYLAYIACVGGQMDLGRKVLQQLKSDGFEDMWSVPSKGSETRAYAVSATALYEIAREGDFSSAYRLLLAALDSATSSSVDWMTEIFDLMVLACLGSGREQYWTGLNSAISAMDPPPPMQFFLIRDTLGDPARDAHGAAERIGALRREYPDNEPWQVMRMAFCAVYIDDLPAWRSELRRVIEQEEIGGSVTSYMTALLLSAFDGLASGQWAQARSWAERGLTVSARLGFYSHLASYRSILGVLGAAQGDYERALEYIRAAQDWAQPRNIGHTEAWTYYGEAQVELARQHYAEAYESLARISAPGTLERYQPMALMVFMDTVVAAWKSGKQSKAHQHLAAGRAAEIDRISPRLAFQLAACEALVAGEQSGPLYEAALSRPGIGQWPFDEARIRMAYGEWLSANGQRSTARAQFQSASAIFSRLDARPWFQRSQAALEVIASPGQSTSEALNSLTGQERRIATLAAEGRTNKEIAEILFLSPRTVSSHLYKIFPKLGVTSRSALHTVIKNM